MKKIITLTVNPAIDKSTTVSSIRPNSKLRCSDPVYEPGGGGINVSRAILKLGGHSLCTYLSGGPNGALLDDLLNKEGVKYKKHTIQGWTRENFMVMDESNEQQYRFGMPGPMLNEEECRASLALLEETLPGTDFLVASGSLSPGMPEDYYAKVAAIAKKHNVKLILDTSGHALLQGAKTGVFLLKPNLGELGALCGATSVNAMDIEDMATKLFKENTCEVIVVSLGPQGARLLTRNVNEYIPAPTVHKQSTVGAGDSMVAGMVLSLAHGKSFSEMAWYGVACGTAATLNKGTQLCKKEDADKLYQWMTGNKHS